MLPCAHITTRRAKSLVKPIVVNATWAKSTCSLCGIAVRSITVGAVGASVSRSFRRTAALTAGASVLAADSGPAATPAASARVNGAASDSLATWKADSAPANRFTPATRRRTASSASDAGTSVMS